MTDARPTPLTNGQCCFTDEEVKAVDAKPVEDLDWRDYAVIFTVTGCAVLPEQRVWFLRHALAYARREADLTTEFLPSVIYFVADRDSPLTPEMVDECRDAFRACFRTWTAEFDVKRAEAVIELLNELCRFIAFIPLAEELFASLLREGRTDADAAWYLELSRKLIVQNGFWERTPAMNPAHRSKRLVEMTNDVDQIVRAFDQLREGLDDGGEYWRALRDFFGLT
jgi:hypothetical protein